MSDLHPSILPVVPLAAVLSMTLAGCKPPAPTPDDDPAPPPSGPAWLREEASARGVEHVWNSGHVDTCLLPEIVGGGAALIDIDNDGDLDLYLTQAGAIESDPSSREPNRLLLNDGSGRFTDITAASGTGDRGYGMGVAVGDFDDDGFEDLYVTNLGPNVLYRNRGDGTFEDVTERAGVGHPGLGASATFVDLDRDGRLDLFVTNYVDWSMQRERTCYNDRGTPDYCAPNNYNAPAMDVVYFNDGDGTFTDASRAAGLSAGFGNGLGVAAADFDGDGWLDVFVANDGNADQLWRNRGDRTFEDVAIRTACAFDENGKPKAGMGVVVEDVDDDADPDILVCNLRAESDSFHINEGAYFVDGTARFGLGVVSRAFTRFGMGLIDFDQDGWLDLYQANGKVMSLGLPGDEDPYAEPNLIMRGSTTGRFGEVHPRGGTESEIRRTSRAAAFGDLDGDGRMDVVVANRDAPVSVLMNVAPAEGGWALIWVRERSGRVAQGATVSMTMGDRTITRGVRPGYSYLASSDPRIHVGTGASTTLGDVTVTWADGVTESFGDLDVGTVHTLRRGSGRRP